jgi:hypothetical protein
MRLRLVLLFLATTAASRAGAQESGSYVATLGNDTVYVESFQRTPTTIQAFVVFRAPRTDLMHYTARLRSDGSMEHFELHRLNPDASARTPTRNTTLDFLGDSMDVTNIRGDSVTTTRIAAPRWTVPMLHPWHSYSLLDVGLRQSLKASGDSVPVTVFMVGGRGVTWSTMAFRDGKDALGIRWVGGIFRTHFDSSGHLDQLNATETTVKTRAVLGGPINVRALALEYARRDSTGKGLGAVSPRDTVRQTVGSVPVMIDYGRPSQRGRTLFGGLVPDGEVWRTGADAATQLEIGAGGAEIAGRPLPAGKYTLWLLPRPGADTLIVNSQSGQWGTSYDAAKDFLRVAVERQPLAPAVERFTISVEPSGHLNFDWGTTRFRAKLASN